MKGLFSAVFSAIVVFGTVFVMEYNGYSVNPCNNGACFAIEGYEVDKRTEYCDSISCVEKNLAESGTEHLAGIYKITYYESADYGMVADVKKVKVIYRATVEESGGQTLFYDSEKFYLKALEEDQ